MGDKGVYNCLDGTKCNVTNTCIYLHTVKSMRVHIYCYPMASAPTTDKYVFYCYLLYVTTVALTSHV